MSRRRPRKVQGSTWQAPEPEPWGASGIVGWLAHVGRKVTGQPTTPPPPLGGWLGDLLHRLLGAREPRRCDA